MTVSIPSAAGVPGISGPPDWLSGGVGQSNQLDDVRWRAAVKRAFGSGVSGSNFFRATQSTVGTQKFIYLTFRAAFVQELNDGRDMVYLGLQKHGTTAAMVVRLQAHGPGFTPAGPPSANPPASVFSVQVSTLSGGVWSIAAVNPTWINANARMWLQSAADVPTDPNNRWAIQLRIPANVAGGITDNSGPNLGTDFDMWYVLHGSAGGNPVILADYRTAGTTTEADLVTGTYPLPASWDEFILTSGAATSGGVALYSGDVVVKNAAYGEGTTIDNGQNNSFIARPRNYSSADIPAGAINATFRIANWGSVGGDPDQIDFSTGVWEYVPGNSELVPVISNIAVPTIPAGNSPPLTTPIKLDTVMNLPAGKSKHQCVLVTMSGANLNFLNDAIYRNMNYDTASLLEREAEISIVGLKPFSPKPRDVYLAIEKVNLLRNAPGADEGQFLKGSMARLMQLGGPLAEKLKNAQAALSDVGDSGSAERLAGLLDSLMDSIFSVTDRGAGALRELTSILRQWLTEVKSNAGAAKRLEQVFDKLADWLEAAGQNGDAKLAAFIDQLKAWLSELRDDPASLQMAPGVLLALRSYHTAAFGGGAFSSAVEKLARWLAAGGSSTELPGILEELRQSLSPFSSGNPKLKTPIGSFSHEVARWLRGSERLDRLVSVLSEANLTEEEMDQLFPTLRVHVYHDSGERVPASDGSQRPVLRVQSAFGLYVYHEGSLEGWQTSIEGAQRIADNLYLLAVPNDGSAKIKVRVQAVEKGQERIPEDPIKPIDKPKPQGGCLGQILRLFGIGK